MTPRRRGGRPARDPEGRMPLREHLAELRRRVLVSILAIALGAAAGWFIYDWLLESFQQPLIEIAEERDQIAQLNFGAPMSALNIKIKLSTYLGVIVASPVWLYQIWRFITPGLTRRERGYSIGFTVAAVPLFLSGVALAWVVLPNAIKLLTEFTPENASNIVEAQDYIAFATRLILAFGIAFVAPLFLVALNFVGILSGRALGRQWRIAVFLVFLFCAIASPSPDAGSLLAMALPMTGLYAIAVGVCLLNDRRRARKHDRDPIFGMDDDEAGPLESPGPAPGADPA